MLDASANALVQLAQEKNMCFCLASVPMDEGNSNVFGIGHFKNKRERISKAVGW
jgi:hypothetical protein